MGSRGKVIDLRKRVNRTLPLKLERESPSPRRKMPLKQWRRRVRALWLIAALSFLAATVYGIHLVSYFPKFSLQEIQVSGTNILEPELVRSFVETLLEDGSYQFISRKNIFVYPRPLIEKAVPDEFPRVRSVAVSRGTLLSQTLRVTVEEREPFAYWCADECYLMDEGGFIFARSEGEPAAGKYVFKGEIASSTAVIGHTFIAGRFSGVLALLTYLQQAGFLPLGITVEGDQDFSIPFAEGFKAYASFGRDTTGLVRDLQLILSSNELVGKMDELDYVDLRFGNRVYFKLKGE